VYVCTYSMVRRYKHCFVLMPKPTYTDPKHESYLVAMLTLTNLQIVNLIPNH